MFIDVHCHLDMLKGIPDKVLGAKKAGVGKILAAGVDVETNKKVLVFSRDFEGIKACLGIYPIDALKMSDSEIEKEIKFILEQGDKVEGIGEVGMDYKEDKDNWERQKKIFGMFIDLAKEMGKPIVVHSRKAEKECIELLEERGAEKVIMHCFFGKRELIDEIVENGWYLSIPTCVCYNEQIQEVVKRVPIEKLLCETDSPFLHPFRRRNNEPRFVVESYKKIANMKGLDLKEVEEKIEKNFKRLFY